MNAVEKALRHIEKLIAQRTPKPLIKTRGTRRAKSAESPRNARKVINQQKARVVSAPRRHRKPAAYNPEPAPVDQVKLAEQQQVFAPAPTPPEVEGPIRHALWLPPVTPPPAPPPVTPSTPTLPHWAAAVEAATRAATPTPPPAPSTTGFVARGSCKAVDADTGRQCRLPAHAGDDHRSERGLFRRVALPGQTTFALHQRLDEQTTRALINETYNGASHVSGEGAMGTGLKRRGLLGTIEKTRKSAHSGGDTSTGLKSIDQPEGAPA